VVLLLLLADALHLLLIVHHIDIGLKLLIIVDFVFDIDVL